MTNYKKLINMSIEEMAMEIKLIANWDRKEKGKAEKDENFYSDYLLKDSGVECRNMGSDYCGAECACVGHNICPFPVPMVKT